MMASLPPLVALRCDGLCPSPLPLPFPSRQAGWLVRAGAAALTFFDLTLPHQQLGMRRVNIFYVQSVQSFRACHPEQKARVC
jgi:hypothetical protein